MISPDRMRLEGFLLTGKPSRIFQMDILEKCPFPKTAITFGRKMFSGSSTGVHGPNLSSPPPCGSNFTPKLPRLEIYPALASYQVAEHYYSNAELTCAWSRAASPAGCR